MKNIGSQTHPRIPDFEHLQGKIIRIECDSGPNDIVVAKSPRKNHLKLD
jgi:hypothetical protein